MDSVGASGEVSECGHEHLLRANDLEPSVGHRHLLTRCPVHREDGFDPPFYVVSRYANALATLLDPDRFRNGAGPGVFVQEGGVLGSADDPDHRRHRRVLQDAFRPRAVAALAPRVEQLGREMWNSAFDRDGEGDFVRLFAFPYPALVIAELLGVPSDRRHEFGEWSDDIVAGLGGGDLALVERANQGIYEIVAEVLEARLESLDGAGELPDDLITRLARAHRDGELRRSEVLRLCQQLLVAGHETTASLIGLMLYRLITVPGLMDRLRDRPDLLDAAVEEFLRFDAPVQGLFRMTSQAVEIDGVQIPASTKVQILFAAANRDPEVFSDPDDLDVLRHLEDARPHLSFGWGVHHCIGAPLARREARLALGLMLDTFDEVELTGPVAVNTPFILRGLTTLPIRWRIRPNRAS